MSTNTESHKQKSYLWHLLRKIIYQSCRFIYCHGSCHYTWVPWNNAVTFWPISFPAVFLSQIDRVNFVGKSPWLQQSVDPYIFIAYRIRLKHHSLIFHIFVCLVSHLLSKPDLWLPPYMNFSSNQTKQFHVSWTCLECSRFWVLFNLGSPGNMSALPSPYTNISFLSRLKINPNFFFLLQSEEKVQV